MIHTTCISDHVLTKIQPPFLASHDSCSILYGRKSEKGGTSSYHNSCYVPSRLTSQVSHKSHISYLLPPLSLSTPRGILPSETTTDTHVHHGGIVGDNPNLSAHYATPTRYSSTTPCSDVLPDMAYSSIHMAKPQSLPY